MVSQGDIEALIGPVELTGRIEDGGRTAQPSPGMHPKHYSPQTPLLLVESGSIPSNGRGVYLWRTKPSKSVKSIAMPRDAAGYAAVLYKVLHQQDRKGWDWIAVEKPPEAPDWAGILDRLERASTNPV